jgi:hypothetical protein
VGPGSTADTESAGDRGLTLRVASDVNHVTNSKSPGVALQQFDHHHD